MHCARFQVFSFFLLLLFAFDSRFPSSDLVSFSFDGNFALRGCDCWERVADAGIDADLLILAHGKWGKVEDSGG